MRCPLPFVVLAAGLWSAPSIAAPTHCDAPSSPAAEVSSTERLDGSRIHVFVGMLGTCDVAMREVRVALPALSGLRGAIAQLALAGLTRHYGLHRIGFTLGKVEASPDGAGVTIRFAAAVEGLEGFQLAYTLYVTADR